MPIINNLTGVEIEITKLADILTGTDYDITDAYYGDLHIFTVWGESEGALPRTFNANGDNAVEWRIDGKTSGNLFDIGLSTTDYISPSYTNLTISNDTLSMKLSSESGMTYAIRTQRQTQKGAVTFAFDTDCDTGIGIIVRIRDNDDTRWLTSLDTSISGFTYNNVYNGWYKWTPLNNGHPIQAITIPNVGSYYYVGFIFAHTSSAVGNVYSATNIRLIEGTYTSETIPPYEPYGSVGERTENLFDKDATEDAYIDVEGNIHSSNTTKTSNYISVLENTSYTLYMSGDTSSTNLTAIVFFDSNKNLVSYTTYVPERGSQSISINTPASASYVRFSVNNLRENVMLTEGSTAPASYIPYGYKVPMAHNGAWRNYNLRSVGESANAIHISVEGNTYTVYNDGNQFVRYESIMLYPSIFAGFVIISFDIEIQQYPAEGLKLCLRRPPNAGIVKTIATIPNEDGHYSFMAKADEEFVVSFFSTWNTDLTRTPYRYTLSNIQIKSAIATSIPLYIGSTPLDEGEYTSYADQKIYKYVSGVLTPTEPPVSIPALPTLNGVTVVDTELDSSAVQPEKAVIKYRKENT